MKPRIQKYLAVLGRAFRALNPAPNVGGLEISETAVRYLSMTARGVVHSALRLPQGIIKDGVVADQAALLAALRELHRLSGGGSRPRHVVLTLPSHAISFLPFSAPAVSAHDADGAARLNLSLAAPFPAEEAYADYISLGEHADGEEFTRELVGIYARRKVVDAYVKSSRAALFFPIVVESPALALVRALADNGAIPEDSALVHFETQEGAHLVLVRGGIVVMSRFVYWSELGEKSDQAKGLAQELHLLELYHQSRWGALPVRVSVASLSFRAELGAYWYVALGAALRGRIPRGEDQLPTLAATTAAREYYQGLLLNFITMWRTLLAAVFGALVLIMIVSALFLTQFSSILASKSEQILPPAVLAEIDPLMARADAFNALVDKAVRASAAANSFAPSYETFGRIASSQRVALFRVALEGGRVMLVGRAPSEEAIVAFKQALEREGKWSGVTLPLASIKRSPDNTYSFSLTMAAEK